MNIIFLDVDGVITTLRSIHEAKTFYLSKGILVSDLDPKKIAILKKMVTKSDIKIVLTGAYRESLVKNDNGIWVAKSEMAKLFLRLFERHNLELYDKVKSGMNRVDNITMYLNEHPDIERFLIIDDENQGLDTFGEAFLKVNSFYSGNKKLYDDEVGLQEEHIDYVKNYFKVKNKIK